MPLLIFTGTSNTLVCQPWRLLDTQNKEVALVYFSGTSKTCMVVASFVENSSVNSGSARILAMTDHTGPPLYLPLEVSPDTNLFTLKVVNKDLTDIEAEESVVAICEIRDRRA